MICAPPDTASGAAETNLPSSGRACGPAPENRHTRRRTAVTGEPALSRAPVLQDAGAQPEVIVAAELVPAHLLDGGEIVIFAIKPSVWFVVFSSFRWLAAMALVIVLAASSRNLIPQFESVIVVQTAVLLAGARILVAMMQWVSRLYVLTNRRIMRLTGIFHVDLFECALTHIDKTAVTTAWYERLTGTGTILFATAPAGAVEVSWNHVDSPMELHERVRSAIHRAKSPQMR